MAQAAFASRPIRTVVPLPAGGNSAAEFGVAAHGQIAMGRPLMAELRMRVA